MSRPLAVLVRRAAALLLLAAAPLTHAQTGWPNQPIRLVVPFPPGGLADLIARPLAEKLTASLGQPVVIENRGGASGTLGTTAVAEATPDGYTLLFATANEIAVSPILYQALKYSPDSFTPVASVVDFASVLVTGPGQPDTLKALLQKAHEDKEGLTFASSGAGTTNHLAAELFKTGEKVDVLHVHYKGGGPAMTDVAGGHVDAMFATLPSALGLIASGRLNALAVTGSTRSAALPDVPTIAEAGGQDLVITIWAGVLGPKGLDPNIVTRLNDAIGAAVGTADFQAFLDQNGAQARFSTPAALADDIHEHYNRWSTIIRQAGISVN